MHFQICGNNDGNIIHVFKIFISISVATVLEVSKMTVPICTSHWCLVMSFWLLMVQKLITIWPENATSTLQDCLTTVVGLISNNDETHYREEVAQLAEWCGANNLSLNVEKTKEVVLDFRRRNFIDHPPLTIDSSSVERVSSTKFLGVHITEDLTWTTNTMSLYKKA